MFPPGGLLAIALRRLVGADKARRALGKGWGAGLVRISRRLTVEARNKPAITVLRLLAVLNALSRSDAEGRHCLFR